MLEVEEGGGVEDRGAAEEAGKTMRIFQVKANGECLSKGW